MNWFDILKTNFYFDPDNPEGGNYSRATGEVSINLANKDYATSMGLSEDEFVDNLIETLAEEYTHEAIDPEVTEAWMEYMEENVNNFTPEEIAAVGHTMHEIGANAGRGYSPLGTWLMVMGHGNVTEKFRTWVSEEKIPSLIDSNIEKKVVDTYNLVKQYLDFQGNSGPISINLISTLLTNQDKGVFSNVLA